MARHAPSVLLVDPDRAVLEVLENPLRGVAFTTVCLDFFTARRAMLDEPPDLLVTNLRLEAFNGLHLVYLARDRSARTRCVVYDETHDPGLARAVQEAGAFYERRDRLAASLIAYALCDLPASDRRNPMQFDRRGQPRGGRRAADLATAARV